MATPHSQSGFLKRINWEDLYNTFLGLEQRRQILVLAGGGVIVLLLIFVPITCASSKLGRLEKEYKRSREGESGFLVKIAEYQDAKQKLEAFKKKMAAGGGGESLTTLVESVANEVGVGGNIERLKPASLGGSEFYDEEGVDAVITGINLDQVTRFLYRLEHHENVPIRIKKLQLKPRYGKREELTASFQASTIRFKGEEGE